MKRIIAALVFGASTIAMAQQPAAQSKEPDNAELKLQIAQQAEQIDNLKLQLLQLQFQQVSADHKIAIEQVQMLQPKPTAAKYALVAPKTSK